MKLDPFSQVFIDSLKDNEFIERSELSPQIMGKIFLDQINKGASLDAITDRLLEIVPVSKKNPKTRKEVEAFVNASLDRLMMMAERPEMTFLNQTARIDRRPLGLSAQVLGALLQDNGPNPLKAGTIDAHILVNPTEINLSAEACVINQKIGISARHSVLISALCASADVDLKFSRLLNPLQWPAFFDRATNAKASIFELKHQGEYDIIPGCTTTITESIAVGSVGKITKYDEGLGTLNEIEVFRGAGYLGAGIKAKNQCGVIYKTESHQ